MRLSILPAGTKIQPWDWWYYAEKVRKAQYDLDENITKPYFQLDNVRKGVFAAAEKLYGIKIVPEEDLPVYNPEVKVYRVLDADGSQLSLFLTDYLPRSTKRGGAWMSNFREQYVDATGKRHASYRHQCLQLRPAGGYRDNAYHRRGSDRVP